MNTKKQNTTTPSPPESTPKPTGHQDNWMIMQLGEMRGDIKALTQSIDHLCEKIGKVEKDIESINDKVGGLDKKIYAATAIIALVVAVGGYFANKAIDFGLDMAKQSAASTSAQADSPQNTPPGQPKTK
jgi:hypothetical protein